MFERFDSDARTLVAHAIEHARRWGYRPSPGRRASARRRLVRAASEVMRAHGVTPELVEEEIVRRVGLGAGSRGRCSPGSTGMRWPRSGSTWDAVRARIEASFGPQAHGRGRPDGPVAGRRAGAGAPRAHRLRLDPRRALPPGLRRRRRPGPAPTGPAIATPPRSSRLPRRPATGALPGRRTVRRAGISRSPRRPRRSSDLAVREAAAQVDDTHSGVEHIALALTTVRERAGAAHPGRRGRARPRAAGGDPRPVPAGQLTRRPVTNRKGRPRWRSWPRSSAW